MKALSEEIYSKSIKGTKSHNSITGSDNYHFKKLYELKKRTILHLNLFVKPYINLHNYANILPPKYVKICV